ncbi:MAG: peptidoglycan DD-metalloendopeptidase family protein, partial [Azoarcus sp.]|nr:peptidoglycan DD-metalloendopeptidase family protein [Azoarcus sp.]
MNKHLFTKRLLLPVLVGMFVAGCTHTKSNAPVRDSRPTSPSRTTSKTPSVETSAVARPGEHIVRRGETLFAVSRLYGVPVQDLIDWNNLSRPEQLEVGQILRVAAPGSIVGEAHTQAPLIQPEIKNEPRGGKEAWSEEAWARLHPQQAAGNVPTAASSEPKPGTDQGPGTSGYWMWPVKGEIISRFNEPIGEDGKMRNRGIDIAGTQGTPVLAAAGGNVAYAGNVRTYGNMVIIKHNDEYLTAYGHNHVILVQEGDTVTKGQKIAE